MTSFIVAQAVPDLIMQALTVYGPLGVFVIYFMIRDGRQQERESARQERQEEKMDNLMRAINHLTRAISLEVLTRPNVVKRAQDEARELQDMTADGKDT